MGNRIIIVSNRLPFKIEKRGGEVELRKSTGGLVSAVESSIKPEDNIVWVGAADFSEELWKAAGDALPELSYDIHPVFIDKRLEKLYYNGFSNTVIWPLFHYFPTYADYREEYYEAYATVNGVFAEVLSKIAGPDDLIWVHDYHLMLLPGMLKEAIPGLSIGFFLHIPFPSYELLKPMPERWRTDIFNSLLHCDVVGFHTREYASHFSRSISYFMAVETSNRLAHYNDRLVLVKEYPISIDFAKFNEAYNARQVAKGRKALKQRYKNLKMIFSVDRLDYTKGVINRLQAYEELLRDISEIHEKVVFIINVIPSRDKMSKYAERRRMIEEQVSHINGLYGNVGWQPIIYQYSHLNFNQLVAFYTACDVALVTPLRDGMNLVAKEFVASRYDKRGVLILSEFAGASVELDSAILVNPNDITVMKTAMMQGLSMNEKDQEAAMERMQAAIRSYEIVKWTGEFLGDLKEERMLHHEGSVRIMTYDERTALFAAYRQATSRLLLLDYDGTLSPFHNDPQEAKPSPKTMELLNGLAANPRNRVVLISGRDKNTLEQWFGGTRLDLVAEHGAVCREQGGHWKARDGISSDWKPEVRQIMDEFVRGNPGTFVEEKEHSVVWHYRTAQDLNEEDVIPRLTRELTVCNTSGKFAVMQGSKIVEARNSMFDKGAVAREYTGEGKYGFVLAVGDDTTDEAMFAALKLPGQFTVKVGLQHTAAMYNLVSVSNVFSFLQQLVALDRVPA